MQYSSLITQQSEIRNLLIDSTSIDENLLCGICQELVVQPKECDLCQHLFCEQCITDWSKKNSKCPYKCSNQAIKLKEPHKFVKNTISHIQVKCANPDCDKTTEIGVLDSHLKECQFTRIVCQCGLMMKKMDYQKHNQECQYRLEKCEKCETEYKINQQHDCIKYLKNLILQQGEAIKKIQDVVLIQQQIIEKLQGQGQQQQQQQQQVPKFQGPQCQKGHQLVWKATHKYIKCDICQQSRDCRYHCLSCGLDFCQLCKQPVFSQKKCPINHEMSFDSTPRSTISCDFCRSRPYQKNEPVWSDRACNFDLCNTCYLKWIQK